MSAGAVIYATGRGKLTELGHLAGPLRLALIFMMIGAFSISGVPYFNGYVSKSMIVSAAAYSERAPIELLLLIASMGTFLHTGLKLPWFTFFGKDQGARVVRPVPVSMYVAMGMASFACIITGIVPGPTLYALLPFDATYNPFTGHHFIEAMQLLLGTALGFWLLRVKLGGEPTTTIDVDRAYRQPLLWLVGSAGALAEDVGARTRSVNGGAIRRGWQGMLAYQERFERSSLAFQSTVIVAIISAVALAVIVLARSA
jgi:multicomponent Na+:H+ antiporter subunit D